MTKKDQKHSKKKVLRIAGASEVDHPKSDDQNIWDPEFGWILRYGKTTENTKAYWAHMRRKPKQ
jgi:hypothetical protein